MVLLGGLLRITLQRGFCARFEIVIQNEIREAHTVSACLEKMWKRQRLSPS